MEVLDRQQALLSNYEVYLVLQEEDAHHKEITEKRKIRYPENVTTLKFEALQYLNNTPCTTQTAEQIAELKNVLAEYELTKAEILQIINLRPKTPVELHFIIEECDERFGMEDLEQLAEIVVSSLPRDDDNAEEGEEGEEDQGDAEEEADGDVAMDGE
ncbi:hypothetical protein LPJ56_001086 [Coemansia sp. RSA 2599]|nr:hypothetical protein LPJ75_000654 [Coemansia sp. RSA 2598]KAJ1828471.1 hypothetical protein LPJ56_001086 [Coemansia sp. RSA 2599]